MHKIKRYLFLPIVALLAVMNTAIRPMEQPLPALERLRITSPAQQVQEVKRNWNSLSYWLSLEPFPAIWWLWDTRNLYGDKGSERYAHKLPPQLPANQSMFLSRLDLFNKKYSDPADKRWVGVVVAGVNKGTSYRWDTSAKQWIQMTRMGKTGLREMAATGTTAKQRYLKLKKFWLGNYTGANRRRFNGELVSFNFAHVFLGDYHPQTGSLQGFHHIYKPDLRHKKAYTKIIEGAQKGLFPSVWTKRKTITKIMEAFDNRKPQRPTKGRTSILSSTQEPRPRDRTPIQMVVDNATGFIITAFPYIKAFRPPSAPPPTPIAIPNTVPTPTNVLDITAAPTPRPAAVAPAVPARRPAVRPVAPARRPVAPPKPAKKPALKPAPIIRVSDFDAVKLVGKPPRTTQADWLLLFDVMGWSWVARKTDGNWLRVKHHEWVPMAVPAAVLQWDKKQQKWVPMM